MKEINIFRTSNHDFDFFFFSIYFTIIINQKSLSQLGSFAFMRF